jgi:hypothetical protein
MKISKDIISPNENRFPAKTIPLYLSVKIEINKKSIATIFETIETT